jgi:hypothetical protein
MVVSRRRFGVKLLRIYLMLKLSRALVHLEEMGQQEGNDSQLAFLGPILARQPDCSASLSNTFQLISGCKCEAGIGVFERLYLPLASCHSTTFRSRDWPKRMLGQDTDL